MELEVWFENITEDDKHLKKTLAYNRQSLVPVTIKESVM